ncbi:MAG: hypothetical protein AABX23_01115 [Nanoarchaeota archaeon]
MKKEMVDKEIRHHDNSAGIAGLVLGILSVMSGVPGLLLGFIGFWFSLHQHKHSKNKWSKWGIALNIIGFVLAIVLTVYLSIFVRNSVADLQGLSELSNYGQ